MTKKNRKRITRWVSKYLISVERWLHGHGTVFFVVERIKLVLKPESCNKNVIFPWQNSSFTGTLQSPEQSPRGARCTGHWRCFVITCFFFNFFSVLHRLYISNVKPHNERCDFVALEMSRCQGVVSLALVALGKENAITFSGSWFLFGLQMKQHHAQCGKKANTRLF